MYQKNAAEMVSQCCEFLENAGYDKHALWGNAYSQFMSVIKYLKMHGHTDYVPELADAFVAESRENYISGKISRNTYKDRQRAVRRMNVGYALVLPDELLHRLPALGLDG